MAQQIWTMKRGEHKTKKVWVRAAAYTAGGKLFFAAKQAFDNDASDQQAVVNKVMTDDDIVDTNDDGDKAFLLEIENSDTQTLDIEGETDYFAEFQYVNTDGHPVTYPGGNDFILRIIPDVKVGIV
jgi:hypothetical protein